MIFYAFLSSAPPKCPFSMEYDTDTSYYYRYLRLSIGISHIEFGAKANSDVHLALSPSENSSELYEIVIGGWNNTQSVIRRCEQCSHLVTEATDLYLSANEFRWFWITFDSNGAIAVGRKDESTSFMKWADPDPLEVQYLGYSTGFGSSGQFRFCCLG
ncbi:C3 and PZP-like alpha-2-macroglobulin domain-containing protein 8 [Holothuria leucospilota]|uniref:C3 and PZP-like alpha-2-macroglobulin domain-containing protein 8 n=1 Tax=Holothuria leucospilota TaxID=206669 RepID=A0A9Q0YAN0_HOLLE|nr:C3 and PZP-like alpha-2-macroglobulin domain-containing protein 8 [Holothuria leucospilota]